MLHRRGGAKETGGWMDLLTTRQVLVHLTSLISSFIPGGMAP
jgi:hypothetical protein